MIVLNDFYNTSENFIISAYVTWKQRYVSDKMLGMIITKV